MLDKPTGKFSIREKANCLSILLFWWLRKVLHTGWKRELTDEDVEVYPALYADHSGNLGSKLEQNWIKHLRKCAKTNQKPSLRWTMFLTFGPKFLFIGIFSMLEECVFRIIQVISLGFLINYFSTDDKKMNTRTMAYLACAGIIWGSLCFLVSFHWSIFNTHHVCTHMRLSMSSLIYRKTLRLSQATMRSFSTGQLITMLSSDVHRFDMQDLHLNYLWVAPLQLGVVIYLLYFHYEFGLPSLGGLVLLITFVTFQYIMSIYISRVRNDKIVATNKRMRLITEIMNAFYNIKLYAWENFFYARAKEARRYELGYIKKTMILKILNTSLSLILTKMTVFLTLIFYINIFKDNSHPLDAEQVFITLVLYEHVRINLAYLFTHGVTDFAEISVTARRMTDFLLLEEKYVDPKFYEVTHVDSGMSLLQIPLNGVKMDRVSCKWHYDQENLTLENINLELTEGKMLAIVGPTGSGKSSLLGSILGELPTVEGKISVQGKIAYVSQTPWLFPGTVRQNIIFGKIYNDHWYTQVMEICGLKTDFDNMEEGDHTKVVRAGLSLGQKARISLARAVYANCDIYIMDDPLNCVDVRLQRHILESCIRGALKNKAVLLVTHQLHFLEAADDICIILDGKIRAQGAYKKLLDMGIQFSKEVDEYNEDIEGDDDTVVEEYEERRSSVIIEEEEVTHHLTVKELLGSTDEGQLKRATIGKSSVTIKEIEEDSDKMITSQKIGIPLFWAYIRSSSSWYLIAFLVVLCFAVQFLYSYSDIWLEHWIEDEEKRTVNARGNELSKKDQDNRKWEIIVYCCLIPSLVVVTILRSFAMFKNCINASLALFCQLLNSLLHAKARFMESNCAGHGINRFSKDMIIIDELLPTTLYEITGVFFEIIGATIILCYTNYWSSIPSLMFLIMVCILYQIYHKSATALKRLEANARSPVYAHTSKTLEGLSTIRAFEQEQIFLKIFDDLQDNHTSAWYLYLSMHAWLAVAVDWISIFLISSVILIFVIGEPYFHAYPKSADVGLAVAKVIELSILMQIAVTEIADTETEMISVERILEYTNEDGEGDWENPYTKPPDYWPLRGHIVFKNITVRGYGNKTLLNNISIEIQPGEKIGIIGRSGSGKSTFVNALFRITEPREGQILVDDINIRELGLHDLRERISIIPQAPYVFAGTLRMNLDPFDEYSDHEIWAVLDEVNLFETVKILDYGLDTQFTETGWQFSAGQAQLLGLARALLKRNQILCLDEATANLDPVTQSLILKKIKESFRRCTVIKVAHRLHTVIDCDKIIVIEDGNIVDYGEPFTLINEQGPLYTFVMHLGKKNAEEITKLAKESFVRRRTSRRFSIPPSLSQNQC